MTWQRDQNPTEGTMAHAALDVLALAGKLFTRHLAQGQTIPGSQLLASGKAPVGPDPTDSAGSHRPVIFVHGTDGSRVDLRLMSWYLRLFGRRRHFRMQLSPEQSPDELADILATGVSRVQTATGEPLVDIVAHGVAGLVVRLWVQHRGAEHHVGTLVTLGSPHNGTTSPHLAVSPLSSQLKPHGVFVRRLNSEPWPRRVRAFTFWSRNDGLVRPAESSLADGFVAVDMTPFTHVSYAVDPKSWEMVRLALESRLEDGDDAEATWQPAVHSVLPHAPMPVGT